MQPPRFDPKFDQTQKHWERKQGFQKDHAVVFQVARQYIISRLSARYWSCRTERVPLWQAITNHLMQLTLRSLKCMVISYNIWERQVHLLCPVHEQNVAWHAWQQTQQKLTNQLRAGCEREGELGELSDREPSHIEAGEETRESKKMREERKEKEQRRRKTRQVPQHLWMFWSASLPWEVFCLHFVARSTWAQTFSHHRLGRHGSLTALAVSKLAPEHVPAFQQVWLESAIEKFDTFCQLFAVLGFPKEHSHGLNPIHLHFLDGFSQWCDEFLGYLGLKLAARS